ncbi:MAG TPA: hypothetical protein VK403_13165, partial [Allosphingosinicella sp.]|nr:hypothetical protein [Allosphingosinicella sp.]
MKRSALLALAALAAALAPAAAAAQSAPAPGLTGLRYDLAGRQTGAISPDPDGSGPLPFPAVRNSYNDAGWLVKVERGALASWQSEAVAPSGWPGFTMHQKVETLHDSAGRKLRDTVSGAGGAAQGVTQYSYDSAGRLECTAVRMNASAWASLPASACTLGPEGSQGPDRISRNEYDSASRVRVVKKGVGTPLQRDEATYSFTPNGQRASLTDARGYRAEMKYDPWDRQSRWVFPSRTSPGIADQADYEEYGHDPNGNRTALRKRDGRLLLYHHDALNRVFLKEIPNSIASVRYAHDLRGLQTSAWFTWTGWAVSNAYDGFGRLISSTSNMGGTGRTVGSVYDGGGNRVRVIHPDGSFFTYEYDGLDRLKLVRENGGDPVAGFSYDPEGRRSTLASGGTASSYGYDPAGRLQSLAHNLAGTGADQSFGFAYNRAGQIVGRSGTNDSYAWTGPHSVNRPYSV